MSIPCQVERPPSPGRLHASSSPPPVRAHQPRYATGAGRPRSPRAGITVRTTPIGPSRPSASAAAPKTSVHAQRASKPEQRRRRAPARRRSAITSSSSPVQAEALDDVDRSSVGTSPALAERRPHQHHRGDARLRPDRACDRQHEVADQAADEDRDERRGQRERRDEDRPCDDHEQPRRRGFPRGGRGRARRARGAAPAPARSPRTCRRASRPARLPRPPTPRCPRSRRERARMRPGRQPTRTLPAVDGPGGTRLPALPERGRRAPPCARSEALASTTERLAPPDATDQEPK